MVSNKPGCINGGCDKVMPPRFIYPKTIEFTEWTSYTKISLSSLVGGLEHDWMMIFHILGIIIIPTDSYFLRGVYHQPDKPAVDSKVLWWTSHFLANPHLRAMIWPRLPYLWAALAYTPLLPLPTKRRTRAFYEGLSHLDPEGPRIPIPL